MADAAAICEAVTRRRCGLFRLKAKEQQAVLMIHRSRELLVRQHTMLVNALRAHLAEFGLVMKQGKAVLRLLLPLSKMQRVAPSALQ